MYRSEPVPVFQQPASPFLSDSPAIEVQSLQKFYRGGFFGRQRVAALRGVSLQVARGDIFGLLGPNGAGKTTLIKVLLGIVRPSGGTATLLGWPSGDRRGRQSVGYLPESHRIPRHHTGNTALEYYGSLSGMPGRDIRRRRPELLERVGLGAWGKTSVKNYSKGMLQRLGLAQALMHEPELLVLDEPTDGVDPVGRSEMRAILRQLKDQGRRSSSTAIFCKRSSSSATGWRFSSREKFAVKASSRPSRSAPKPRSS